MAQELSFSGTVDYEDTDGVVASIDLPSLIQTLGDKVVLHTTQAVGTSEEALGVGDIATRRQCWIVNRDDTNIVNVKVGTGGAIFATLVPGDWLKVPLGSGAQSPFVIALVAECKIEYLLCAA